MLAYKKGDPSMMQIKFSKIILSIVSLLTICLGFKTTPSRAQTDYSGFASKFAYPVGIGMKHVALLGNGAMNTLHAEAEIKNDIWTGLGLGFDNGFDELLINATLRYNIENKTNYAFFTEFDAGFLKISSPATPDTSTSGFLGGLLFGFEYSISRQLRMSWAYGLQYGFGEVVTKNIGFTNNSFIGNFSIHYYL